MRTPKKIAIIVAFLLLMSVTAICEHTVWDCSQCGKKSNKGNYCGSCGHSAPWLENDKKEENFDNDASAVYLDLEWQSGGRTNAGGLYVLTINGNKLEWGQTVETAVQFCRNNGISMEFFNNDEIKEAFALNNQKLVFIESIELNKYNELNENYNFPVFLVREWDEETEVTEIDMDINQFNADPNVAIECAQDIYQKLLQRFSPSEEIRLFADNEWIDTKTNDISAAIKQLIQLKPDYGHVHATFDNLKLYITRRSAENDIFYDVSLILSFENYKY